VSSVQKASIEKAFKGPPNAFDEALVVGYVGFGEIDPKPESFGDSFPFLHVSPDALLAFSDEGFHTEGFDFLFGVDT
jgi:hypothetical protein